jgi:hypothetical protein
LKGRAQAGSIRAMAAANDPRVGGGGERRADVAIRRANDPRVVPDRGATRQMAAANDPRVTSGKASTAGRARADDPRVGTHPGRNLGKFLHRGKR